jgi:hypothetical protein
MPWPFELITVPGQKALATLAQLQAGSSGIPLILGDAERLANMQEIVDANSDTPFATLREQALAIDVPAWFAARIADDPEYYLIEAAPWPEHDPGPNTELIAHCDITTGEPYPEVLLCIIPTHDAWLVPCYLPFGGWNACPAAEEHSALWKYWGERYGAQVVCIADDVVEMQVARPPTTREAALQLAREQFIYCTDIVDQGVESIEALAALLLNASVWYFWWD